MTHEVDKYFDNESDLSYVASTTTHRGSIA
jgi:hypothetical protein